MEPKTQSPANPGEAADTRLAPARAEEELRRLNATLEQRVAERTAELTASEARLRTLIESAPEALVVFDGETGRFVMVNENAVRLYGRSREELMGLNPGDVSPPFQPDGRPSRVAAAEKIREALEGGRPVFDWLHAHPDGRQFLSEVRLVRLPSEGRPLVRASVIDTTERRRREQTQRAVYELSEAVHAAADLTQLYARIHEIVGGLMPAENFFIALFDPATDTITFPYFVDERTTEVPQPRKVSTGLTGLVLRTGRAVLADREFATRSRREGDRVVVEALGGASYIESGVPAAVWLGVPLTIQGQPIGVMAVQDYRNERAYGDEEKRILTFVAAQTAVAIERKRGEEALRELVEKHRALFLASSQGVMLHDDQRFLEVNPAAVRILGRRHAGEIIGHHPSAFAPEFQPNGRTSAEQAAEHIAACLEHGSTQFEWTTLRPDGSTLPLDVLLTRVQWGGRWLIQAMVEDITERKRAEDELRRNLSRAQELGELRRQFVSMVSHEFRTPLGVIQSSAEILRDYLDRLDPGERRQHLDSITRNTQRMAGLMEEVLLIGRLDAAHFELARATVELRAFTQRMAREVEAATGHRCPILLAPPAVALEAEADERLLRPILVNLLSNAVKYSEPNQVVHVQLRATPAGVEWVIRDAGIGIPAEDLEWVFQPFHRGRNVGERAGSGLGLVIVRRCVELHGGTVSVASRVNDGTAVTVRLPRAAGAAAGSSAPTSPVSPSD